MKILSIETSCDETAVSIVEATGGSENPTFIVLGNALFSQIAIHKEYGGVFPMLAKREHAKNLSPILKKALTDASLFNESKTKHSEKIWSELEKILEREEGLYLGFRKIFENIEKPDIDVIAVTSGPGLEPALWVGISFAEALGKLWNIPVIGTNHMEGHIASILIENSDNRKVKFPALALLISGGHTEIVEIESWGKYSVIGETLDDAVGEAFDKVARMLELPYPGGPEVSKLAEKARIEKLVPVAKLPRPMIYSNNLNFSFSGLKTAVLYYIRDNFVEKNGVLSVTDKSDIAREFEDAVVEVLLNKMELALNNSSAKTLIVAGGVIANKKIREIFMKLENKYNGLVVKIPTKELSTDNALMIACATYLNINLYPELLSLKKQIIAKGNIKLGIATLK
ncbi:MAG: tRNA (adenosine(37)-N6)-threonylcarbamoyltransferase complex transferase subunit TsaD [Minisyncoccia bacterium]